MGVSSYWEEINHTADWAIRVRGSNLAELMEYAAYAMVSLVGGEAGEETRTRSWQFELEAGDAETLLIDWLTELIYLIEEEGVLFQSFSVALNNSTSAQGSASGIPGGAFSKHIKAATYHDLDIKETDNGLETVIVLDV